MKKFTKVLALVVVASMLCLILASCGGLSGKYEGKVLYVIDVDLTFKGSKITIECGDLEAEGTYKIDGDKITIELSNAEDDAISASDALIWFNGEHDFEKDGDTIKIDDVKFKKAD